MLAEVPVDIICGGLSPVDIKMRNNKSQRYVSWIEGINLIILAHRLWCVQSSVDGRLSTFLQFFFTFADMEIKDRTGIITESSQLQSEFLERTVKLDFYLPVNIAQPSNLNLLLINDGQDLVTMGFAQLLDGLHQQHLIQPLLCVGIHCGEDRRNEFGMVSSVDYKGRGARASQYSRFIFEELLPFVYSQYALQSIKEKAIAGFSLGGLSALDLAWNNTGVFQKVGVFSGSLWWRSKDRADKDFNENTDRLMHRQIRNGKYIPGLKFFFQCGELDEAEDRNRNGVIDSIDDTLDVMRELFAKGYLEGKDMKYLQLKDGRHDVQSWAKSFPSFLEWGWSEE